LDGILIPIGFEPIGLSNWELIVLSELIVGIEAGPTGNGGIEAAEREFMDGNDDASRVGMSKQAITPA